MDIATPKGRIAYLDVAKGLLIIMVVFGHICWATTSSGVSVGESWRHIDEIKQWLWSPFFMPCFFIITGFCSNFDKEFGPFLKDNVFSLLWPMLILQFGNHWFVWALFISKMIYYFVYHYVKATKLYAVIFIALAFAGSLGWCSEIVSSTQRFYWLHGIGLSIYIYLGRVLKSYVDKLLSNPVIIISIVSYMGIVVFSYMNDWKLPAIFSKYNVAPWQVPLHLLLSCVGSIMLLGISKWIDHCSVLEYLGKNSLVIFFVHVIFISIMAGFVSAYTSNPIFFFLVLIVAIAGSSLVAYILNKPVFSWLIGKVKKGKLL